MVRPWIDPALRPGARRWRLEKAVQNAIDLLDAMDGDNDLEDSDGDACPFEDLPALEFRGCCDDAPGDPSDAEDGCDAEAGTAEDEWGHPHSERTQHTGPGCPIFEGY